MDRKNQEYIDQENELKYAIFSCLGLHHPKTNFTLVKDSLQCGKAAHLGQKRATGEPFNQHPFRVAAAAAAIGYSEVVVSAAIFHDSLEDTHLSRDDLLKIGGPTLAYLVQALTKDLRLDKRAREPVAMRLLADEMLKYPAIFGLKLLDRLDNLCTVSVFPPAKCDRIRAGSHHYFGKALKAAHLDHVLDWIDTPPSIDSPMQFVREIETRLSTLPLTFYEIHDTAPHATRSRSQLIVRQVSDALRLAAGNAELQSI